MPDYRERASVTIGEIGCGSGTAMGYLQHIPFKAVEYFGVNISMIIMQSGLEKVRKDPTGWQVHFARADAANKAVQQRDNRHHVLCLSVASFQAHKSYQVGLCCHKTRRTTSVE